LPTPTDVPGLSGTDASDAAVAREGASSSSEVGRADSVLASRAANDAMRASSWASTAEKGRSAGSGAGEQGLRGWCSVRWSPELFRCWDSAVVFFAQINLSRPCQNKPATFSLLL
jgi:hypothetical protein